MTRLLAVLRTLGQNESGASIVEYALALLLIGVITLVAISVLGGKISTFFISAANSI